MLRVLYPDEHQYTFNVEETFVEVGKAKDILPTKAYEKLISFVRVFPIKRGMCHITAYKVSLLLRDYGVLYCDGYYSVSNEKDRTYCHSFCKYEDKYFDPTYEFGAGWGTDWIVSYYSSRTYDPYEIRVFFVASTFYTTGFTGDEIITPATIEFEPSVTQSFENKCFMIDEDGYLRSIDNPSFTSTHTLERGSAALSFSFIASPDWPATLSASGFHRRLP